MNSYEQQLAQAALRLRNAKEATRRAWANENRLAEEYAKAKSELAKARAESEEAELALLQLATTGTDTLTVKMGVTLSPTAQKLLGGVSQL